MPSILILRMKGITKIMQKSYLVYILRSSETSGNHYAPLPANLMWVIPRSAGREVGRWAKESVAENS